MTKTGIVTGGTKGIGRKIVEEQLKHGYQVIATYHSDDTAVEKMKFELSKFGNQLDFQKVDNSKQSDQEFFAQYIRKEYSTVDFLVNNAGISISDFSLHLDLMAWQKVLNTNLTGVFLTIKNIAPLMLKSKTASIVNISSQVGLTGNYGQIAYSAAKAGINGITKTLAQELGKKDIRVNSVAPGFIETDILNEMTKAEQQYKRNNVILERFGKVKEVADVVDFLISDRSSYINAAIINVDGGRKF